MGHKTELNEIRKTSPRRQPLAVEPLADETVAGSAIADVAPAKRKRAERPEAVCRPAKCPSCGSTSREPFRDGPVARQTCTVEVGGQLYNRQIWRNTRCKDCGQRYRVIEYRNKPAEE